MKLQKLVKYQYLFWGIFIDNGIKMTLAELANLIFSNYDEFLVLQPLIEEYMLNYTLVRKSTKENYIFKNKLEGKAKKLLIGETEKFET